MPLGFFYMRLITCKYYSKYFRHGVNFFFNKNVIFTHLFKITTWMRSVFLLELYEAKILVILFHISLEILPYE